MPSKMACREYREVEEEPLIKKVGNNGTVVRKDKVICTVKIKSRKLGMLQLLENSHRGTQIIQRTCIFSYRLGCS
jgi:DNA-binding transcriptional regulator YhcF (GntR family)